MATPQTQLAQALDSLQAKLPQMIETNPNDGRFWDAFMIEVEAIESIADEGSGSYVIGRINAMLAEHGRMIAGIELEELPDDGGLTATGRD